MDQIVYQLTIDDVQTVALQELGEELTLDEIKDIEDLIAERIDWYEAIAYAIDELQARKREVRD